MLVTTRAIRGFVASLCLAICASGAPAAVPGKVSVVVRADITIDSEGRIRSLAWREQSPLQEMVSSRVEAAVRSWQFEPGRINGAPAETRTGLAVRVAVEAVGGDTGFRFEDASTGVVSVHTPAPPYPKHVARRGGEGAVAVTLDVAPDGSAKVVDAIMLGDRLHAWRGKFIPAATQAASEWVFRPETVGGRPVPARVTVAVNFALCDACDGSTTATGAQSTAGEAVSRGSVATLLTAIQSQEIRPR